tara:strand:- start:1842 stop:2009 length:168 start_codon:yes stop_codon:yes gene_type:complete
MSDEEEASIETVIMTIAYMLVQDKKKKLKDFDEEVLLELKMKIDNCYKECIGTLH